MADELTTVTLVGGPCGGRTAELDDPRDAIRVIFAVVVDDTALVLGTSTVFGGKVGRKDWERWQAYCRRDGEPLTYDHTPELNPSPP